MVTPAVGAVVLVPFPFSDLSRSKLRPTLYDKAEAADLTSDERLTLRDYLKREIEARKK